MPWHWNFRCLAAFSALACGAHAQTGDSGSASKHDSPAAQAESVMEKQSRSPWLLVPLISSNPKLGTSVGGMVGYITRFDSRSEPSLLGLQAQYSNTSSRTLGIGGKFYWNENRDRVNVGVLGGEVSNDYLDFLGTGQEVRSEEKLRAVFLRYQHQFFPSWFFGAQAVYSNYDVEGTDPTSDQALELAGLAGSVSSGIGLIASYDTRNNTNNPTEGTFAQLHNLAFRESLGSDADFDVVTADWRWYTRTSDKNVVVLHAKGRWTRDAPESKQSTVELRGYTRGQYLGRNSLTIEAENRYMLEPRWGGKAFAGVACLYGGGEHCSDDQIFPMFGAGLFYVLKPASNMVVSAEFAKGSGDNRGFYLNFGHRF
jgi:outer membrane protein assembly factor BamA